MLASASTIQTLPPVVNGESHRPTPVPAEISLCVGMPERVGLWTEHQGDECSGAEEGTVGHRSLAADAFRDEQQRQDHPGQ